MHFAQKEGVRKEGRFWQKEDFQTKGTFHITTGTKQLQMSFYKFGNKDIKYNHNKNCVLGRVENIYFAQMEDL